MLVVLWASSDRFASYLLCLRLPWQVKLASLVCLDFDFFYPSIIAIRFSNLNIFGRPSVLQRLVYDWQNCLMLIISQLPAEIVEMLLPIPYISDSLPLLSRMYPSLMWRRMKRSGEILAPQGQNRQSFAGTERILRSVSSFTASTNCIWHQDNQLASRPHFYLSMAVRVQLTTAGQWVFQSRKFFGVESYTNMLCLQWKGHPGTKCLETAALFQKIRKIDDLCSDWMKSGSSIDSILPFRRIHTSSIFDLTLRQQRFFWLCYNFRLIETISFTQNHISSLTTCMRGRPVTKVSCEISQ